MVRPCPRGAPLPVPASSVPTVLSDKIEKEELSDETVVTLICMLLMKLQAANVKMPMPSWEEPISVFFSVTRPEIETLMYVRRLVRYANCSHSAFICAVVYLYRLETEYPLLALTEFNLHRLFITALMIAAKTLDDRCYSNAHYSRVGGIASVRELNRLELHMLRLLKFQTYVYKEEYVVFIQQMAMHEIPIISPRVANFISATYFAPMDHKFAIKLGLDTVSKGALLSDTNSKAYPFMQAVGAEHYGKKQGCVKGCEISKAVAACNLNNLSTSPGLPVVLTPEIQHARTTIRNQVGRASSWQPKTAAKMMGPMGAASRNKSRDTRSRSGKRNRQKSHSIQRPGCSEQNVRVSSAICDQRQ